MTVGTVGRESSSLSQKREKGNRFSIITLVLSNGTESEIPELLKSYVWKAPSNNLEAIREIVKALPLTTGMPFFKKELE